jgi:hypothetical protein
MADNSYIDRIASIFEPEGKAVVDTSKIAKNPDKGLTNDEFLQMEAESLEAPAPSLDMEELGYSSTINSKLPRQAPTPKEQVEDVVETANVATNMVRTKAAESTKDSNPGSLQSKLAASLSFFAPDLIGGLVGGLLAGTEGAAAGMAGGGDLRQQQVQNDLNLAQLDLQRSQMNRLQKSEDVIDTRTNSLVSFNPMTGQYVNQEGDTVPTEFQKNIRVEREERLSRQGDDRIGVSRVNSKLRELGLYDKFDEDSTKKKVEMLKAVEGNKVYQQAEQALAEGRTVTALVDDAFKEGGQSLAALGTRLAKYMGEVGVLTEEDVTRYVKNPSIVGGIVDTFQKAKSGNISGASRENILRMLDVIGKEQANKQEAIINKVTSRRAKTTRDFDEKTARDIVGQDDLTRQDPTEAKRRRLEELRRKARGQ